MLQNIHPRKAGLGGGSGGAVVAACMCTNKYKWSTWTLEPCFWFNFLTISSLDLRIKDLGVGPSCGGSDDSIINIPDLLAVSVVCVCSVWVPCVALPSGGGSSVGPSALCGSPVWVPCAGPLCGSPVWVPCVGPLCVGPLCGSPVWVPRRAASCCIYSRDASRSFTRSRLSVRAALVRVGLL